MTQKLRSLLLYFVLPASAAMGACNCAGNPGTMMPPPADCSTLADGTECPDGVCCGGSCQAPTNQCPDGYECGGEAVCSSGTVACECVPLPPLQPGRMADDLDSTVQEDGTLVLAGYSPGDPEGNDKYGDLVVGVYDGESAVDWEIIDGVPASGTINGAPDGWRGGITTPGDDVGRYPAIEAIGNDVVVAYADKTNGALKWAARVGGDWTTGVIHEDAGDVVAWISMAIDGTGLPIVTYVVMKAQDPGLAEVKPTSQLRVARPATNLPDGDTWAWNHYELAPPAPMGCHVDLCADGYVCITEGTCVLEDGTGDCDPACDDTFCFNGACYQEKRASDHLAATALYTDIEPTTTGFGLVYYDRTAGRLHGVSCNAPCASADDWTNEDAPVLIDGFGSARSGAGDCGIGASLFIDSSDVWHVTYVDGTSEDLRYARLPNGSSPTYELVDDGSAGLTGLTRPQISLVGDDSAVVGADVEGGVEVRVAYADTTLHTTVLATRAPGGGWSYVELAPQPDTEASFSVTQAHAGGELSYVGSMWLRVASDATDGLFTSATDVFPNPAPAGGDGGL